MKKVLSIIAISIGILFIVCFSFFYFSSPNLDYVKKNQWRYESGFKIGDGDFVEFDDNGLFKLKTDTLFYKEEPRGIIVFTNEKTYLFVVKSINGYKYGVYIDMEGHHNGFW